MRKLGNKLFNASRATKKMGIVVRMALPGFGWAGRARFSFRNVGAIAVVSLAFWGCTPSEQAVEQPNIVLIIVDDQHRDQANFLAEGRGADGEPLNLTPHLDQLAEQGLVFSNLRSPSPLCNPSRYAIFSGSYASRATNPRFLDNLALHGHTFIHQQADLTPDKDNLAKQMQRLGYRTGVVGKNHLVDVPTWRLIPHLADPEDPEVQATVRANTLAVKEAFHAAGFDYVERMYHTNPTQYGFKPLQAHNMDWVGEGARKFIATSGDQPFFLLMSTTIPHGPRNGWRHPPEATPDGPLDSVPDSWPDRQTLPERLQAAGYDTDNNRVDLLWLDDAVGGLLDELDQRGMRDNTLIIYVNDHGVEAGKRSLYEGGMKSFGFVSGPERYIRKTGTSEVLASHVDIAPTVVEWGGGDLEDFATDGFSMAAYLTGDRNEIRAHAYGEIGHTRAVVKGRFKYLTLRPSYYHQNLSREERQKWLRGASDYYESIGGTAVKFDINSPFSHTGKFPGLFGSEREAIEQHPSYFEPDQLYDLMADPGETRNLAKDPAHAATLAEMKALLTAYLNDLPGDYAEFKSGETEDLPMDQLIPIADRIRGFYYATDSYAH